LHVISFAVFPLTLNFFYEIWVGADKGNFLFILINIYFYNDKYLEKYCKLLWSVLRKKMRLRSWFRKNLFRKLLMSPLKGKEEGCSK